MLPKIPDGCEVAPHCLECPLKECKYDNPRAYRAYKLAKEVKKTIQLLKQGLPPSEVAKIMGVGEREVYKRKLKAGMVGTRGPKPK